MTSLNELLPKQLETLYVQIIYLRNQVNDVCGEYGFSASQLVSRTFEGEVEKFYGKKILKQNKKILEEFKNDTNQTD